MEMLFSLNVLIFDSFLQISLCSERGSKKARNIDHTSLKFIERVQQLNKILSVAFITFNIHSLLELD